MFYWAWVDKNQTDFVPEFARVDEEVFSFSLEHAEGEFPSLEADIINPQIGFLAPSRKQWAWLSYEHPVNGPTPMFFGRVVGVPQQLQNKIVRLTLVARPQDYEFQRENVADTMRVLPYYDPIFVDEADRRDPDSVLEGYSHLWHIDRITHVVSTSDIVDGEDGLFTPTNVIYESVSVSHSTSPARRVIVTAKANWEQYGKGRINLTQRVLKAFAEVNPPDGIATIDGFPRSTDGMICTVAGDGLQAAWPKTGDTVGGGWTVGKSSLEVVGGRPLPPTILDNQAYDLLVTGGWGSVSYGIALRNFFQRSAGFTVQVLTYERDLFSTGAVQSVQFLWVPIYRMSAELWFNWEVGRNRSETLEFELSADVQPLLSDPGDEETIYLDAGTADVDSIVDGARPIGDLRRNRYFATDRGKQSFQHLLMRARAALLNRARAVDITYTVPLIEALDLSCRQMGFIADPRLPGGSAVGKIKTYRIFSDGNTGEQLATITIGCAVGRGGSPTPVDGTPLYVNEGYVDPGYQETTGGVLVPAVGDVSFPDFQNYPIDDDGLNMQTIRPFTVVDEVVVTGGLVTEKGNAVNGQGNIPIDPLDQVNTVKTKLTVRLRDLNGGPFETELTLPVNGLLIPKHIDLEAE